MNGYALGRIREKYIVRPFIIMVIIILENKAWFCLLKQNRGLYVYMCVYVCMYVCLYVCV